MSADVIVIGAGVMGCSVAWRLAKAGMRPLVLERSVPGAEASSAAAGILAPLVEAHHASTRARPAAALELGVRSRDLHATQAEELLGEHGLEIGFRRCGVLRVAMTESDEADLRHHAAMVELNVVDGDEAQRLEPSLSKHVRAALVADTEAQLEPRRLLHALAIAAEREGAVFRSGAFVRNLESHGTTHQVMVGEETLHAPHVIIAAGSWTHLIPGLDEHLNLSAVGLHPVRGQIVATRTRPPLFRRVVFGAGGYVVTRPDGRVLVGSTEERVGFRREVTFGGMRSILDIGTQIAPSLDSAPVLDHWSSFRPGTSDGLPLVGSAGPDGLWLASGHFRNGILLAPVTAEILAAAITGTTPVAGATAVEPQRFGAPA